MKEYIERGELKRILKKRYYELTGVLPDFYAGYMMAFHIIEDDIPNAADVVEVKHSSWMPYFEYVEIYNTGGYREKKQTGWICKKCKSRKSFTTVKENYCSYCGAKMDKEELLKNET